MTKNFQDHCPGKDESPWWRADYFEEDFPERWEIGRTNGWGHMIGKKYNLYKGILTGDRESISSWLIFLYNRKAEEKARELKRWFDELPNSCDGVLTQELINDLFFGFCYMSHRQFFWEMKMDDLSRIKKAEEDGEKIVVVKNEDDRQWLKKLIKLLNQMPNRDLSGRTAIHEKLLKILLEEFPKPHWDLKKARYHGDRIGQKIPNLNKEISRYLRERLAEKLKGRRDRRDDEDDRVANDKRAAELIAECAQILGIKVEDQNRLRKPMKPKKPQTPPKP